MLAAVLLITENAMCFGYQMGWRQSRHSLRKIGHLLELMLEARELCNTEEGVTKSVWALYRKALHSSR